ncbi:MAG: hypothetical protein E6Q50_03025 [Lysobacter sp.]|nr:MAG: hypothetical protein E6Q50_03025 [Lysobacter sp.]
MHSFHRTVFRYVAIASCAAIVANGCTLPREAIQHLGTVTPAQYCPGDTVRASFDLLGTDTCRDAALCDTLFPTVNISSTPTAFAARDIRNYVGGVDFVATTDSVTVRFDADRDAVIVPTTRLDDAGNPITVSKKFRRPHITTINRITGSIESELLFEGTCAGGLPAHMPAELLSPTMSPNLRLTDLCNTNSMAVTVTLSGGAPGTPYPPQTLAPGQCLNTMMPGVPDGVDRSTRVDIRSENIAVGVYCTAVDSSDQPPPLRLLARKTCG